MKQRYDLLFISILTGGALTVTASGQWVQFEDQTASRMVGSSAFIQDDYEERDFSWGDLNNNGWVDLVVMRKQVGTSSGRRPNALFMNEGGVLVERSGEYAGSSDVAGDQGFRTATNDRDSVLTDINLNGWLDLVTAPTLSDGLPKHISYPRVYVNQADDQEGNWLGLKFENDRIPQFEGNVTSGQHAGAPHAPRFCAVDAGDLTGNGYPDLYFADYNSGGVQTLDFDDRILINDGNGFFADESEERVANTNYLQTNFGTAVVIADLNKNGLNDILRVNSLGGYQVNAFYNNPTDQGNFIGFQNVEGASPYYVAAGDLNNNGRLDIVVARDGTDAVRYNLSSSTSPFNPQVTWSNPQALPASGGFRSNVVIADLNNNGWKDILIADMDVDLWTCTNPNRADVYRNNGGGDTVSFTGNPDNPIPFAHRLATFDFAVFDITGNGWNDIVQARCNTQLDGTYVWINQPQFGIEYDFDAVPATIDADAAGTVQFDVNAFGQPLDAGSVRFNYAIAGGAFVEVTATQVSGNTFQAELPAIECETEISYYVEATLDNGFSLTGPFAGALGPNTLTTAECGDPVDPCPQDLTGDGEVNVFDLLDLLGAWGSCDGCPQDLTGDGEVNVFDLLNLLDAWGSCG